MLRWTKTRQNALRARLRTWPDFWARVEAELARIDPWALAKGWLTIDWILGDKNATKLFEGNYRKAPAESSDPRNTEGRLEAVARKRREEETMEDPGIPCPPEVAQAFKELKRRWNADE